MEFESKDVKKEREHESTDVDKLEGVSSLFFKQKCYEACLGWWWMRFPWCFAWLLVLSWMDGIIGLVYDDDDSLEYGFFLWLSIIKYMILMGSKVLEFWIIES